MTPIGYTLHGHPLCLSCLDGDADLIPGDVTDAHDSRRVDSDVVPIHPGDPADGAPCAGCGLPLAPPPEASAANIVWTCPECGSTDLCAFYSERRMCRVGARWTRPHDR